MKIDKPGKMPRFTGFCRLCRSWVSVEYGDKDYKIQNGNLDDPFIGVWCKTEGCPNKIFLKPTYPEDYMPKQYECDP